MTSNPIPNELRSNHLFLLVGTNPLPDWVATRLLLREDGLLYLVHSDTVREVAKRLAKYLMDAHRYRQPIYVRVESPYKAGDVFNAIAKQVGTIQSGAIGLNYTGGTKVMSTHGYRALEQKCPVGLPPLVFSYLEAPGSIMHIDPTPNFPGGCEFNVGLVDEVRLGLVELFKLHEEFLVNDPVQVAKAEPVFNNLLARVHSKFQGQDAWRKNCNALLRDPKKPSEFKKDPDLRSVMLKLDPQFGNIADTLSPFDSAGTTTLGDIVDSKRWGFTTAKELAEWLDGKWLEHYVLQKIKDRAQEYRVNDFGRNINPSLPRKQTNSIKRDRFEADVAAIRGYQLHLISCYSGSVKDTCKQKLFEVFTRARQLGGDESRAALVCCFDDPRIIEQEVGQMWDMKDRVKVFGRIDLLMLGDRLRDWFATGAK
jgi:hypothetical protein